MRGRTPMSRDNVGWLKAAKRVEWCPEEVRKNNEKAQDKYKKYFDDIHKSKEIKLCVDDAVRVKSSRQPDLDTVSMDEAMSGDRRDSGGAGAAETPGVVLMSPGQSKDSASHPSPPR
ncbi:hypothetical protein NDU88_006654 [Pleurodeles waltl]|uniref:Uncharacterized protein n=1 Tax=Pleurodeles waltl TaxID=8319 RepID=A0AAV7N442_PLEWA|nr:hypothetical protein NDU88_006654 [Pleurodeles waltl]